MPLKLEAHWAIRSNGIVLQKIMVFNPSPKPYLYGCKNGIQLEYHNTPGIWCK